MKEPSRRQFLAATSASAVALGVTSLASGATTATAAELPAGMAGPVPFDGASSLLVCVDDAAAGQLSVLHGDHEFAITDKTLADQLVGLLQGRI